MNPGLLRIHCLVELAADETIAEHERPAVLQAVADMSDAELAALMEEGEEEATREPVQYGRSLLDVLRDEWPDREPADDSLSRDVGPQQYPRDPLDVLNTPEGLAGTRAYLRGLGLTEEQVRWEIETARRDLECDALRYVRDAQGHEHDSRGRFTSPGGGSSTPATRPGGKQPVKPAAKPAPAKPIRPAPSVFAAREQRHAEAQQVKIADAINEGAESIDGSAPSDIERPEKGGALTCLEVKTKLKGKAVRMSAAALARKARRLAEHEAAAGKPAAFHTVAIDHRAAYRTEPDLDAVPSFPCYYKRGCGSFSLAEMERVEVPEMLNKLIATADADLPDKAQPTTSGWWGLYSATRDPRKRATMIRAALANERQRTRAKGAALNARVP